MALINAYTDAYLAPLVTEAREAQATAEVADLGTLPAAWVARLTVLRAYIVTCVESMKAPDDTFAAKLSAYRKEFDAAQRQAIAAQQELDAAGGTATARSLFGVELVRS